MQLVIASSNTHKISEIQAMLQKSGMDINCISLKDIGFTDPLIEDALSFDANALKKAKTVGDRTSYWVLADDSGLCVNSLNGAPGVFSARYAGENATDDQNNQKLLQEIQGKDPKAYFHCSLVLYQKNNQLWTTNGKLEGEIIQQAKGKFGFGYDPIF